MDEVTFHRIPLVWVPSLEADDSWPIYSVSPWTMVGHRFRVADQVEPDVIVEKPDDR